MTPAERALIKRLVRKYAAHEGSIRAFSESLLAEIRNNSGLSSSIHSIKSRLKDASHLEDKLKRKMKKAAKGGVAFDITEDNLFEKITDLVGIRILHLHTKQMKEIDLKLKAALSEAKFELVEGPIAHTWDEEYKNYFKSFGVDTVTRDSMYTSVHYVVKGNRRTGLTAEIQVRTLMEEVWGEVSHSLNYPHETDSLACKEQLKVLARISSGGTRLVDSIFACHQDHVARS